MPPITLGGIAGGPITIGPAVRILGQASVDAVEAEVALTLGARLDIPAESVVKLNFDDSTDNNIGGWVPSFTPVGPELSGSVSVSASVGPRIQLEVALTILGFGVGVGLALSAPTLGLSLGADANTAGGICDNPEAQLGVNIDVGLSAQLDAFGGVGDISNFEDLPINIALVSTSSSLFSTCLTIGGSAPSDAAAAPVDVPVATTTVDSGATPTDAAATATGTITNFTFADSQDCTSTTSEDSFFVDGECKRFVLDGDFTSASLNFAPMDVEGSNCVLVFFGEGDDTCTTQVGFAFQPSSGQCIARSDVDNIELGDDAVVVKFMRMICS